MRPIHFSSLLSCRAAAASAQVELQRYEMFAISWDPRGSVFGLPILDSPTRRIEVR